MYVVMHVCMYACMYVCMHACMHVYMHACMYACMHACMYVCMYDVWDLSVPFASLGGTKRLHHGLHKVRLDFGGRWPLHRVLDALVDELHGEAHVILRFMRLCTVMSYILQTRVYLQDCAIPSIIRLFIESLMVLQDVVLLDRGVSVAIDGLKILIDIGTPLHIKSYGVPGGY